MKEIQFVDLQAQYKSIKDDVDRVVADVIDHSLFIRGPYVEAFENKFSALLGTPHCVSCGNGTDSLYIALKALKIKPGDEVICPAHSWISTSETITQAGGRVVFCDTNLDTFTIDTNQIESLITKRTVGIVPVHLFGQAADMDPILKIARTHGLWVMEDCAQAHLAEYRGKKVGTFGNVASFSFYPGKNLGAMGDAGAVITSDQELATYMAMFARHGGLTKGEHLIEGINSRMDGLQAAVLSVKCDHITKWTKRRQAVASYYLQHITNPRIQLPALAEYSTHVWHLFVIKCEERNELQAYLKDKGIPTVINYPVALPFLPAYEYLGGSQEQFPNAYHNQSRILSIPIYPELESDQIEYIVDSLNSF
ncbi:DegT/DnrJ/EryC1/StrS aminotransferase family protein [Endozoicomonas sp. YOMI1]|uniref:DegT/DnrJ/EryC1/StrS family aminotransferase n=1 Tax=Endozoicomonas sp. YOMI1 TaxID=2828739 RepID=UPI00214838B0|nr:DegT/DnrJ/EryC1/StrS family aminotransferase [Endozoicomonas sp. YOMI1]